MKIGIVSDTHLSIRARKLPDALVAGLQGVDLILHAGDWTYAGVAALFEEIAPIDGVAGNNDGSEIMERFGRVKRLELAGKRIGMFHGDGQRRTTEQRAREAFRGDEVDLIIFGHSHVPYLAVKDGMLMLNPGSPTDKRRMPRFSFAVLSIGEPSAQQTPLSSVLEAGESWHQDELSIQLYYYDSKA